VRNAKDMYAQGYLGGQPGRARGINTSIMSERQRNVLGEGKIPHTKLRSLELPGSEETGGLDKLRRQGPEKDQKRFFYD